MYERFFGLRERPFDLTPDPRFLFLSPRHHEALTHLKYGLSGRPGITLMVGDAGTGKSTLIRATLDQVPSGSRIAVLSNPTLTRAEFYEHLTAEFGFTADAAVSKTSFVREMEAAIDNCGRDGGIFGLIVDEAQSLPNELLEELRLLTNVGHESLRSLTLVLAGQPELAHRLNQPELRQLKQRVALRAELTPFTLKETAGYVACRITTAGGRADQLFTRDAVVALHAASRGLPRVISVLCDNALVNGFATGSRPVDAAIVADVCKDFDLLDLRPTNSREEPTAPPAAPARVPSPKANAGAAAQASAIETSERPVPTQSMFDSYHEPKRFSFFRGARR